MKMWAVASMAMLLVLLGVVFDASGATYYVNGVVHASGDGTTWAKAFKTIQEGVDAAETATRSNNVFVAKGTYAEARAAASGALVLKTGVRLYGGFAGTETTLASRNLAKNKCVIDGSAARTGHPAYHVASIDAVSGVIVDGFTIQGGDASTIFVGKTDDHLGGGIFINASSPTIANCVIIGNSAKTSGGAIYLREASPSIVNCLVVQNTRGIYCDADAYPTITNCTIQDNTSYGVYVYQSHPVITNCILDLLTNNAGVPVVSYSCLETTETGTGNLDAEPLFWSAADGDYTLTIDSPCLNVGTATGAPAADLVGVTRPLRGGVDMGCYELPEGGNIWYVDYDSPGTAKDGKSWANAFWTLQQGIDAAAKDGGGEVWVAEGLYTELRTLSLSNVYVGSLFLRAEVDLYGGFDATETERTQRDIAAHPTTIDGSTASAGVPALNVVVAQHDTTLDGFVITGGIANGATNQAQRGAGVYMLNAGNSSIKHCMFSPPLTATIGAGLYAHNSSPLIVSDCSFSQLTASTFGGGVMIEVTSATVVNCKFRECSAANSGGGLCFASNSTLTMEYSSFASCTAGAGGALYALGSSSLAVTGCQFWGNSCTSQSGGAVAIGGAPEAHFTDCAFSGNSSVHKGGAATFESDPSGGIDNCIFSNNVSVDGGAGISIGDSALAISKCRFVGNRATGGSGSAGGLIVQNSELAVTNCLISGNSATNLAGGLALSGTTVGVVANCTLADNVAYNGGGLYYQATGSANIYNCILWGNSPNQFNDNEVANATYCDVQGGYTGTGNLDQNPSFVGGPINFSSGIAFDANTGQSVLTDTSFAFTPNAFVDGVLRVTGPSTTFSFHILANTDHTITAWGDITQGGAIASGAAYQVKDYHIALGSPCIDAGRDVSAAAEGSVVGDWEGDARPFDGSESTGIGDGSDYDIGADEYVCVDVPDLAGLPEASAEAALVLVSLAAGNKTTAPSATVVSGSVISHTPAAGICVPTGSTVDLVISTGPAPVSVPYVINMTQANAEAAIIAAGLTVGTISHEFNDSYPLGTVLGQAPPSATLVALLTAVNLTVSDGHQPSVPNVMNAAQANAEAAIIAAGLTVGTIAHDYSEVYSAGTVMEQHPASGTYVMPGDLVNLVISNGPQPRVPNVMNISQADAEALILAVGLTVGTVTHAYSEGYSAGNVMTQVPESGLLAMPGDPVNLVISDGRAPVAMPNVVGMLQADAETAIGNAGLVNCTLNDMYSLTVPANHIISQDPAAGTMRAPGTCVSITVSDGPLYVANVTNQYLDNAQSILTGQGFVLGTVTHEYSTVINAGAVIRTDPTAGTPSMPGTTVNLVVSDGLHYVDVPGVVGMAQAAAEAALVAAGFTVGTVTLDYSDDIPAGSVIEQDPSVGSSRPEGDPVALIISKGVEMVTTPNVVGMTGDDATSAFDAARLSMQGSVSQASDTVPAGSVIAQYPAAGAVVKHHTGGVLLISTGPGTPHIPSLYGWRQEAAETLIVGSGFTVGTITQRHDDYEAGRVAYQFPRPGSESPLGTAVNMVVSTGPGQVTVPNLVGQEYDGDDEVLNAAGLVLNNTSEVYSDTVPEGHVVSQEPAAGSLVDNDTGVDLVISKGPQPTVPDVVGMEESDAHDAIENARLDVEGVTYQHHPTVPQGHVISQNPAAGTRLDVWGNVSLVVSEGPGEITVPHVVGLAQAAAESAITTAGFAVGTITHTTNATVPAGEIISQNPAGGASAAPGTAVNFVISDGPMPVTVPNVVGQLQTAATTAITGAGLVLGNVTEQYNATVPVGQVISQNPAAGASVAPGTSIALVVSKGPQPVTVPNVVGQTQAAATTAITGAGLVVGAVTHQNSITVPAGSVISQNPTAGSLVDPGSAVALVVSDGPPNGTVPNVENMTQTAAQLAITTAGFTVGTVTHANSATVPAGSVISQNPAGGTSAAPGTVVSFVLSDGTAPVTVPNVVGQTQSAATTAITGAGLVVGTTTQQYHATIPAGEVISQNPAAGASVAPGTSVALVVSKGPQPVTVPNVVNQTQTVATTSITGAGLVVGMVVHQSSSTAPVGSVISQNPVGGTMVNPGTSVALVVSDGPASILVPNVVGITQGAAELVIATAGFTVGTVSHVFSATVPADDVVSQTPAAGSTAAPGSAIAIVVSDGVAPVTVPNVVGESQSDAQTAILGARFIIGSVVEVHSETVPLGHVISQTPAAGASATPGSAVSFVISSGPGTNAVPNVVGLQQTAAALAITSAGFSVGTVTTEHNATAPAGEVIGQNPTAGASAAAGTPVALVVSEGPEPVTVPNLVGMDFGAAQTALTDAGLTLGGVAHQFSATVPLGAVIGQDPLPGTSVEPGSAVTLIESDGPSPITVPDLAGLSQSAAEASIAAAGLDLGNVSHAYSGTVPAGQVVSQSPAAGAMVAAGSTVAFVISDGPEPCTVPTAPGNVAASDATRTDGVLVTWNASTKENIEYQVLRSTTENVVDAVAVSGWVSETQFLDTTAEIPTVTISGGCKKETIVEYVNYHYWVVARRGTSCESLASGGDLGYRGAENEGAKQAMANISIAGMLIAGLLLAGRKSERHGQRRR